jgi:hypothetical protein
MPQYVDAAVSHAKFTREIADYRANEGLYRARGWMLLEARFPRALVVLAAPQLRPPAVVTGVQFDYTNYDAEPPSVRLVDPFTGEPYITKDLPTQLNRSVGAAQQIAIPGLPMPVMLNQVQQLMVSYGPEELPFLCLAGVREYHSHPAHTGDSWELHRAAGAGRLARLLEIIHQYGVQPISAYQVQLVPQVTGFQVPAAPS